MRREHTAFGASARIGYPTQFPSVTMVDWTPGRPNARYWTLKLLKDAFAFGDSLVKTEVAGAGVHARGFVTKKGRRQLLLVNQRDRAATVEIARMGGAWAAFVEASSPDGTVTLASNGGRVELGLFAVAVLTVIGP